MKLITAVIQPMVLNDVQVALAQHGIAGITVTEVSGYARQKGHTEVYRGAEYTIDFIAKVKLEVLTSDDLADGIVEVIVRTARTGQIGDGKVWTVPVDDVVRIRTGERGDEAI
ncbi:MAG TPA: P-II family nitrogen regulator [Propionibacteriaceae bacterium]|nr:P-II family nitrogen regulator [Propionibacteriaceae bacterium]HEX2855995.1 P-II family nitrogen regulator [Propionibacteriaceae bacterium]